ASKTARTLGRFQEALDIATEEHTRAPSYWTALALAGAERARRAPAAAVAAYETALALAPDEATRATLELDIADLYFDLGRAEAAMAAYARVLSRDPKH